ncbi:MAG TPA: two-component regulator propeller domain-containing protein [Bacteroidia bacterium]
MKTLGFFLLLLVLLFACCNQPEQETATTKKEVYSLTGDTVTAIGNEIRDILQDSKNRYWFASNGEGLFRYDPSTGTTVQYTDKHGLCSNFVWNVTEDNQGNIWIKTRDNICYFDGEKFIPKTTDGNTMQKMEYAYPDHKLMAEYYCNSKSLIKMKLPETSLLNKEDHSRYKYDVYSTCQDSKGNTWVGTCTAGVCIYNGKDYTWVNYKELGLPVRCIFEDRNGITWIGNNGSGLLRYDPVTQTLTNITKEMKLENPGFGEKNLGMEGTLARVWSITDDSIGNLWIGTIDAGVWMLDTKTNALTNFTDKEGLDVDAIWKVYKDRNNQLWFGTDGFGVYTLDVSNQGQKKFKRFMGK